MPTKTIEQIRKNRSDWERVGPPRIDPAVLKIINDWLHVHNVGRREQRGIPVLHRDDALHFLFFNGLKAMVEDTAIQAAKTPNDV